MLHRSGETDDSFIADLAVGSGCGQWKSYLEEADQLADQIVVLNTGRVVAAGTSGELEKRIGGTVLKLILVDNGRVDEAAGLLERLCDCRCEIDGPQISIPLIGGPAMIGAALEKLDGAGIEVEQLLTHEPTLDDVFLTLTDAIQTAPSRRAR